MNSMNPKNVPAVDDPRWLYAVNRAISAKQRYALEESLRLEGIQAEELFGDGFSSTSELSSWAAHWAIGLLESRMQARNIEQYRRQFEEAKEQRVKSMMAAILYEQNPHLKRNYVFE